VRRVIRNRLGNNLNTGYISGSAQLGFGRPFWFFNECSKKMVIRRDFKVFTNNQRVEIYEVFWHRRSPERNRSGSRAHYHCQPSKKVKLAMKIEIRTLPPRCRD
jgi:hypothetical protein